MKKLPIMLRLYLLQSSDSLMHTLANSEEQDEIMWHFRRFYTVCQDKNNLQRKKYNLILEITTCHPSIYNGLSQIYYFIPEGRIHQCIKG